MRAKPSSRFSGETLPLGEESVSPVVTPPPLMIEEERNIPTPAEIFADYDNRKELENINPLINRQKVPVFETDRQGNRVLGSNGKPKVMRDAEGNPVFRDITPEEKVRFTNVPSPALEVNDPRGFAYSPDSPPTRLPKETFEEEKRRQERFEGIKISDFDMTDPQGFREGVNEKRAKQLQVRANEGFINPKFMPHMLTPTTTEDLFLDSDKLMYTLDPKSTGLLDQTIFSERNVDPDTNQEVETRYKGKDIISGLFPNVNPRAVGIGLNTAAYGVLGNVHMFGIGQNEAEQDITDDDDDTRFTGDGFQESNYNRGEEIGTVSEARQRATESDEIAQYATLENQVTEIGRIAAKMNGINPEAADTPYYSMLGARVLQSKVDDGSATIYRSVSSRGAVTYYAEFTDPSATARNDYKAAEAILETAYPEKFQKKLAPLTPSSNATGNIGAMPNNVKDLVNKMQKGIIPEYLYEDLLNAVGRQVSPERLNLISKMFDKALADFQAGIDSFERKYFKMSNTDFEKTQKKYFDTEVAHFRVVNKIPDGQPLNEYTLSNLQNKAFEKTMEDRKHGWSVLGVDLRLAKFQIDPNPETNPEHYKSAGKPRFVQWFRGRNLRHHEISRDGMSMMKATTRALTRFAERPTFFKDRVKNGNYKLNELADQMNNILFSSNSNGRVIQREGFESLRRLRDLEKGDKNKFLEMVRAAMFARLFLQLGKEVGEFLPEYQYYGARKMYTPRLNSMSLADLIKYYHLNQDRVDRFLQRMAKINDELLTAPRLPDQYSKEQEAIMARGDLGFNVSQLQDVSNYFNPEVTHYPMEGILEIDQNNSNVQLQAIKKGTKGSNILGYSIDLDDSELFFSDYDSFYDVMRDHINGAQSPALQLYIDNKDQAETLVQTFNDIVDIVGIKNATRHVLVHGFYGLHARVNTPATKALLMELKLVNPASYDRLIADFGSEKNAIDAMKNVYGQTYEDILAEHSVQRFVEPLGRILAMNNQFGADIVNDLGTRVPMSVNQLVPSGMTGQIAMEEATNGMLESNPNRETYYDAEGNKQVFLEREDRIDNPTPRVRVEDEKFVRYDKSPGKGFAQSLSAKITHALDATVMKIAILAQNMGRKIASPNIPIHDANVLNANSWFFHSIAYNNIAMTAIAMESNTFDQLYDLATKSVKDLRAKADKVAERNKSLPPKERQGFLVGTTADSEYRAIFGLLDDYAEKVSLRLDNAAENERLKKFNYKIWKNQEDKHQERIAMLKSAEKLGWRAPPQFSSLASVGFSMEADPESQRSKRKAVVVSPEDFKGLVNINLKLTGFDLVPSRDTNTAQVAPLKKMLNKMTADREKMMKAIRKGYFNSISAS